MKTKELAIPRHLTSQRVFLEDLVEEFSEIFSPNAERGINPLEPAHSVEFGVSTSDLKFSVKNSNATDIKDLLDQKLMQTVQAVTEYVKKLRVQL